MKTTKALTTINRSLLVIFLLFFTGCSALGNRSTDLLIQDLYQKGANAYQQGDYQQAQSQWQQGLTLAKKDTELNEWAAHFLTGLGRVAESSGDYKQAINLAEQALPIANTLSNKALEADAHVIIGQAYRRMGDYPKAKYHSELARQIAHQISDPKLGSDSIRNLGAIQQAQGQLDLAKTSYQESLALAYKAQDKWLQAKALNNFGELSQRKGQYKEALDYYNESLQLRTTLNDLAGQGSVLGNICRVYQDLNAHEQALEYCERALKIARKIHDRAREANHLNNIAEIYRDLGKFNDAKDSYLQSVPIKHQLQDRVGEAHALNNIAYIFRSEGKYEKALEYFSKSLDIKKQLGDRSGQSATNYNIGLTYSDLGQYDKALEHLNQALLIQAELGEPDLLWRIYGKLSYVHSKSGRQWPAIFYGKHAVNTLQSIRSNNQGLDKDLQKSYLEDKRDVYEQLANLLIDQERLLEAQQVLDMLKEEEYYDFIERSKPRSDSHSNPLTYTKTQSVYENKYRDLTARLVEVGQEYAELDQKELSGQTLTQQEGQRFVELKKYRDDVSDAYFKFVDELKQDFVRDDETLEEFVKRNLKYLKPFQDILNQLDNTVLIYYLYNDEKLRILLIQKNLSFTPKLYEDFISRSDLDHLISAFRTKLVARDDPSEEAKDLFKHLIEPMMVDLDLLKPKTLVIYPYRVLRLLPFSALHDGEHYLIEQYAIAMYDAAADRETLRPPPKTQWSVAAFGVSESPNPDDFPDLPAVEDEINAVVNESFCDENKQDDKGILPGCKYMNHAFTPDQLMSSMKKKDAYQVFHLATHFNLTPGSYEDSFLLAGNGGHISLKNLLVGDYQMANIDLITLSACETAYSESDELENDGGEVEGLGTLLQNNGAKAVIATLWRVSDKSTAEFMEQFYTLRELKNLSKAEAIRQTQLLFIRGQFNDEVHDARGERLPHDETSNSQFSHPYYWAPFILMGNWQ